jgi:predicted RNase H-like nuclease (RuvC/YqgF family)
MIVIEVKESEEQSDADSKCLAMMAEGLMHGIAAANEKIAICDSKITRLENEIKGLQAQVLEKMNTIQVFQKERLKAQETKRTAEHYLAQMHA